MPICLNCREQFPSQFYDGDKRIQLNHRKYCLNCNPHGERKFWGGKKTQAALGNVSRLPSLKKFVCKTCKKTRIQRTRNLECSTCANKRIQSDKKNRLVLLLGNRCQICGYNKNVAALSFHHIKPSEKSFSIGMSLSKPFELLEKEVKKCKLLCLNCHTEIHNSKKCVLTRIGSREMDKNQLEQCP